VPDGDKSMAATAGEVWELVVAYFKQETIEPLKGIGRFLMWGAAGSFALGIGFVLVALAGLRFLQEQFSDTFEGNLSVLPYIIVLGVSVFIAAMSARAIGAEKRRGDRASGGTS
jgi:hypothetical protein